MRSFRLALTIVVMVGLPVLVTAEVIAVISPDVAMPPACRLWAVALVLVILEAIGLLWIAERFRRLEGVIAVSAIAATTRSSRADTASRNGRKRTDAEILELFSQED